MYVITYLNAVILGYGLFESIEAVETWKDSHILSNRDFYQPHYIPINNINSSKVNLPVGLDFKYSNPR